MGVSLKEKAVKLSVLAVLPVMAVLLLASCSIAGRRSLINYAKKNFGECDLIREEHGGSGTDEYRTVYLKDKDTGIEYRVTTGLSSIDIDGSTFGYAEGKYSDFPELYSDYILEKADGEISMLESRYGMVCDFPKITFKNRVSGSDAKKAAEELSAVIGKYDIKSFSSKDYPVYAEITVYVGNYDASTGEWNSSKDYDVIDYVHSHYDSGAVFCDSIGAYLDQFLSYEEIQILLPDRDGSTTGRVYYFRDTDGDLFVAVDLSEWDVPGGGIRLFRDTPYGMEEIVY